MSSPALIAETTEDGEIRYEYYDHGAASVTFNYPHSRADERKMGEKYPQDPDGYAESLEGFLERVKDNDLILRVWIDGTCYDTIQSKPLLIECRTNKESAADFLSEYGTLDDEKLENTDREVIDLR